MLTIKQRVKNRDKSQYIQLSEKYSDDSGEESELAVPKKKHKEVPTIEKPVEEGDTLQSISIRYHCTISELKRINNIHKENEIFARTKIKVPIKPFSLAGVHISGSNSPRDTNEITSTVDVTTFKNKLAYNLLNLPDTSKQAAEDEVKQIIFNSNIKSNEKESNFEKEDVSTVGEEFLLLPKQKELVDPIYNNFKCSGVDGDISLIALILVFVIFIVVAPLIYVFYIAEHPEQYNHTHYNHAHHR